MTKSIWYMLHMFSCNSLQKFKTIYFVIYREITYLGKIPEVWILSKWAVGDKYKYVATITMLRGTMHACFSILASIVWKKLMGNWSNKQFLSKLSMRNFNLRPLHQYFNFWGWFESHMIKPVRYMIYTTSPHTLTNFQIISLISHREIAFLGKITKIWIMSKLEDREKFQIRCHHLYA